MNGEHDPSNSTDPGVPAPSAPSAAERDHGAVGRSGPTGGAPTNSSPTPESDTKTVMAGSRPVEQPTDTIQEDEGEAAGEGTLYDRLAKKDQTPVEDSGSSSLS